MAIINTVQIHDRYQNVDPRLVRKWAKNPNFAREQGAERAQELQTYVTVSGWPSDARLTYDALQEGYTDMDALPVATGLTNPQIRSALKFLDKKGYVKTRLVGGF